MNEPPIHFSKGALTFIGFASGSWRVAACGARVDKVWTQEWPPGEHTVLDVTCGNCKRTRAYKAAKAEQGAGDVLG